MQEDALYVQMKRMWR